jgi:hypothetical protein
MSFPSITRFKGLNNVADPLRLKLGWLATADNMDVSNTAALEVRRGYTKRLSTPVSSAFCTSDFRRAYVVAGGAIQRLLPNNTLSPIHTLTTTGRMHWTEVNKQVFFNNGADRGIISEDGSVTPLAWPEPVAVSVGAVSGTLPAGTYQACCTFLMPDGRETGAGQASAVILPEGSALRITDIPQVAGLTTLIYIAPADSTVFQLYGPASGSSLVWSSTPDTLGTNLATAFLDPLPIGTTAIQHWRGQLFATQYLASSNQSVVWASEPLGFHLFNLNSGFFMVPGEVLMLAPTETDLIVGTDVGIHAFNGERLEHLAPYGVVPGWSWVVDEDSKKLMLWTQRGVCRAMPFENLTQEYVSVPPGRQAGVALVRADGHKKFVANLVAGGTAFNQRQ